MRFLHFLKRELIDSHKIQLLCTHRMGFDSTDDCCYNPRRPWGEQCRGGDSCCTEDKQCFEGKADLVMVCDELMTWYGGDGVT